MTQKKYKGKVITHRSPDTEDFVAAGLIKQPVSRKKKLKLSEKHVDRYAKVIIFLVLIPLMTSCSDSHLDKPLSQYSGSDWLDFAILSCLILGLLIGYIIDKIKEAE